MDELTSFNFCANCETYREAGQGACDCKPFARVTKSEDGPTIIRVHNDTPKRIAIPVEIKTEADFDSEWTLEDFA